MRIFWAKQPLPTNQTCAIFLAGPTPRQPTVKSWRPEALALLRAGGFAGEVFVPEAEDGIWKSGYEDQVEWEDAALQRADVILFWIPRDMATMPALTTNDEFGFWKGRDPRKVILGTPDGAASVRYQQYFADKLNIARADSLPELCRLAANRFRPAERSGGEACVPLHIWGTKSFQAWYAAQKGAGNRLDGARVEWVFRVGKDRSAVFAYALHVDVHIASENRNKTNEFIFARPDISTIVAYRRDYGDIRRTKVVLVREFRSPAATADGFIWELPGGSSPKPGEEPLTIVAHELAEETGLSILSSRFREHASRQIAGTLSTHKAHLFSVELTAEEILRVEQMERENRTFGVAADTEKTYVRVMSLEQISASDLVDWSMIGMIHSVL